MSSYCGSSRDHRLDQINDEEEEGGEIQSGGTGASCTQATSRPGELIRNRVFCAVDTSADLQERLHYSDPATTPSPFIPPAQLRDLVIPPTGSSTYRTRLWNKVNDLIEANANVAIREREVRGELWKTWEWQGVGERHVTWDQ